MRLEHINLVVKDLSKALVFYKAAFPHWNIRSQGQSVWHGIKRSWVHFGDDYQYITFNDSGTGNNRDLTSNVVGLAHFAVVVNDLDALNARLNKAGFTMDHAGPKNPYRKNAYYIDNDGFEIEFVQYYSDIPSERNNNQ